MKFLRQQNMVKRFGRDWKWLEFWCTAVYGS